MTNQSDSYALLKKKTQGFTRSLHLSFSCYRIRRHFSFALPLRHLSKQIINVRGFRSPYPWEIWCLWALEDRLFALSGAVEILHDDLAGQRCIEDLEALAQWPSYSATEKLDLPYAHSVQLMAIAVREWGWIPDSTRQLLHLSLQRTVEQGLALIPSVLRDLVSYEQLLVKPNTHEFLHNITLIAQAALAFAAEVIAHPKRDILSDRFYNLYLARLGFSGEGLTEGISYDGYLANFALRWLDSQSVKRQKHIIEHPAMLDLQHQAQSMACPGAVWQSAEIGDVEPIQMPFVWSALMQLQRLKFCSKRESLLSAVPPEHLRSDALLLRCKSLQNNKVVKLTPVHADQSCSKIQHTAAVITLATGLEFDDLSVVISLCRSPMGHIQVDNGTLLIGHAGHWWITDPGYQQYLKTSERDFTLGPTAHNTPVINGYAHVNKAAHLVSSGQDPSGVLFAVLDLSSCYPAAAAVSVVTRTVWCVNREHVVVCDTIVAAPEHVVSYSWHGDADAYWGDQNGAVSIYDEQSQRLMWIQSGQKFLTLCNQHRLRGSRGPCTLQVEHAASTHHWWSFSFSELPPKFLCEGSWAQIGETKLSLGDLLKICPFEPALKATVKEDRLAISIKRGDELLGHKDDRDWLLEAEVNGTIRFGSIIKEWPTFIRFPDVNIQDSVILKASPVDVVDGKPISLTLNSREKYACSVPFIVHAQMQGRIVDSRCDLLPGVIEGDVEYAFYLLVDGQKTQTRWYKSYAEHSFQLTDEEIGRSIKVRGFVRAIKESEVKLSAVSLII